MSIIRDLGIQNTISDTKFIPEAYKYGSRQQRLDLLAGLMDTDGTIYGKRVMSYCTTSEKLRDDFIELVTSLGGICTRVDTKNAGYKRDGIFVPCKTAYEITIDTNFNPFRSARKGSKYYQIKHRTERIIYSIKPLGRLKNKCITVDNEDGSFIATKNHIVTHNSTCSIIRCITHATEKDNWAKWWPDVYNSRPDAVPLIWYCYPSYDTATDEFKTKWWQEYLPRDENWKPSPRNINEFQCDHPIYGWKALWSPNKKIDAIVFNSGAMVLFQAYTQETKNQQGNTVFEIFVDEELPVEKYGEFVSRLNATNGYFNCAFTATLGQEFWRNVMEPTNEEIEADKVGLPNAFKQQISLYDCLVYDDGDKNTPWSLKRIKEVEEKYANDPAELAKRVWGKFVKSEGRAIHEFNRNFHYIDPIQLPPDVIWAVGVDDGTGLPENPEANWKCHPCGIVVIAIQKDFRRAWVVNSFRGDDVRTGHNDIYDRTVQMRPTERWTFARYDPSSPNLGIVAQSNGEFWEYPDKSHTTTEATLNNLFKNGMLFVFNQPGSDNYKLVLELENFDGIKEKGSRKANRKRDDLIDALRYATSKLPWNYALQAAEKKLESLPPVNSTKDRDDFYNGRGRYVRSNEQINLQIADYDDMLNGYER
jgi:hypothetical protein